MTTLQMLILLVLLIAYDGIKLAAPFIWSRAKKLRAPSPAVCGIIAACILFACMLLTCAGIGYIIGSGWKVVPVPPGPPTPDVVVPNAPVKVERVTYVYEKDDGSVPSGVLTALDKLNRQGVIATAFEEDTTDGTGETPEQYKLAKAEAQKAGVPALVVQGGNRVRVVKGVTTEAQVLEVKP